MGSTAIGGDSVKFDLDPSASKVIIVGILEFLIAVVGAMTVILQEGHTPTNQQILTIFGIASIALFTYLLTFVKGEDGQ